MLIFEHRICATLEQMGAASSAPQAASATASRSALCLACAQLALSLIDMQPIRSTRFETLPDDASDEAIDALAADYVAALPTPATPPPVIDPETMEKLLGGRLSPVKLRCLRRVRELLERRRG